MRLAKHLAHAGIASRRGSEAIVAAGRVTVGGEVVRDPARDVTEADDVKVDGHALQAAPAKRAVWVVHKPEGVVSTARDPQGRPTVVSLVPRRESGGRRLYPVGRLDADSTGLILLTDDGDLANKLTHPRYEVPKVYRAHVAGGSVTMRELEQLREGVELDDGVTLPAQVRQLKAGILEIELREGRKRQVRRMCEAVGHRVLRLERIAFGPLRLDGLKPGAARRLREGDVERLRAAARVD